MQDDGGDQDANGEQLEVVGHTKLPGVRRRRHTHWSRDPMEESWKRHASPDQAEIHHMIGGWLLPGEESRAARLVAGCSQAALSLATKTAPGIVAEAALRVLASPSSDLLHCPIQHGQIASVTMRRSFDRI